MLPKLLPKLSDVDANFDEVVEIICLDPGLTMELLRICNSAFFGQSEPIVTVDEAVQRVGYQSVYLLVATIDGAGAFPKAAPHGIDVNRLWAHSVTAAFSTKYIAESMQVDTNVLFTAGLLHDVGKIVLAQIQPDTAQGKLNGLTETGGQLQEKELFGFTHAEVGTALMKRWRLPEQLINAVTHHHEPRLEKGLDPLAACVELGDLFSHGQADRRVLASPQFMSRLNALDLRPTALQDWFKQMQKNQPLIESMSQLQAISQAAKN